MPNFKKLNPKGFTLIELLVVISLIGILSGVLITVINPQGLRAKARDSQRKSDLKQIQTALELYYADNRKYPTIAVPGPAPINNWVRINGPDVISTELVDGGYINNMPLPPNHIYSTSNAGGCNFNTTTPADNNRYNYTTDTSGSIYTLVALMESNSSDDDSKCIDLPNWNAPGLSHCTSGTVTTWEDPTTDVCYGVQNP